MAKKKRKFFSLFVFPGLIGILLFVLLPFGDVVKRSFTTAVTGQWNGLKNYETIFHNQAFMLAVNNTLKFTIICIPLLVFHCPFAKWIKKQKVDEIYIPFSSCHAYCNHCSGMENGILQTGIFKFISFRFGGNDRFVGRDT